MSASPFDEEKSMPTPQPWNPRKRRKKYSRRLAVAAGAGAAALLLSYAGAVQASPVATAAPKTTVAAAATTPPACPDGSGQTPLYRDTQYSFAERAADLVSCMTLAEKVAQLQTNSGPAIPRLGVQQYTYWSEGQHGINSLGADSSNGGVSGGVHATSFPSNFASTMSWDPRLTYQETTDISDEARGFLDKSLYGTGQNNLGPSASDYGDLTFWAPTVNMDRDPLWGRTDEAFGEDPYLTSQMADAFVEGYQGETMSGKMMTPYLKVASTAKHFAMNNVEDDRTSGSSNTTDANVRDYYTKQFQSLVENAHVSGIMTSYNAVNGTPSPVDTYTANELLQRTYGFNGYTTSDCDAIGTAWEEPPAGHAWAAPGWTSSMVKGNVIWTNNTNGQQISAAAGAEAYALRAGTQLDCTGDQATVTNIEEAINAGILSVGVIDNALVHLFTMRMETGEFDPPSQVAYTTMTKSVIQSPAHQALAEKVAADDLVLLQNNNVAGTSAPLLPADPAKLSNVVIVGDLANTTSLGLYSGDPSLQVDAVQGITAAVKAANPNATVTYDSCGTSTTATAPAACSAATLAAVKSANLVIEFVGTDLNVANEGLDRTSLAMPGNYDSMISQVNAVGNPNTALVIQSDGPVDISGLQDQFPAIVFSGYNGESQGTALAQVLFGQVNPAGHLDFTWYKDDSQLAPMENYGLSPSQTGGLGRTYMYFTGTPTYPFGYGLSYSKFTYSHINIASRTVDANATVPVTFDVTNTGTVPGATVAQLYVAPQFSVPGVELPKEQLEGFRRTNVLAPGQTQTMTLQLKLSALSEWDESSLKQVVYDGPYQFRVGPDSATVAGSGTITVKGAMAEYVQTVTVQPDQVVFQAGQTLNLTGANPWIAPDTNSSLEQPHASADNIIEAVNNDQSFVDLSKATVSYASNNPSVVSVDPNGLMHAIKDGVANITVTVNGVSGSAVIVVQGTLTDSTPPVIPAGQSATASATFVNGGTSAVSNVTLSVTVPSGWSASATSATTFTQVAGGAKVTATWQLTPSASATSQAYPITYAATSSEGSFTDQAQTNVAYPSITAAYDNTGISNDNAPSAGAFDGGSLSFSAQALAADGFVSGQPVTVNGITFAWPGVNVPDNIVCSGQTIPVSGSGDTLGFLGASNNGTASGTGTIVYTDGTTQTFALSFADWWAGSAIPGTSIAATTPYLNDSPNSTRQDQTVHLYYASVPLDPTKSVQYVVLPDVTANGQAQNLTALHVFAIGVGGQSAIPSGATPEQATPVITSVSPPAGELQVQLDNQTNAASTVTAVNWTLGSQSGTQALSTTIPAQSSATVTVDVPSPAFGTLYPFTVTSVVSGGQTSAALSGHVTFVPIPQQSLGTSWSLSQVQDGPSVTLGNWGAGGSSQAPAGLAGQVWFDWDSSYLYVTADITDDNFSEPAADGNIWEGDSIQVAATSGVPGSSATVSDASNNAHYEYGAALTPDGDQVWRWTAPSGVATGAVTDAPVTITRDDTTDTTLYELAIPWSDLTSAVEPDTGTVFSISALLNDTDNGVREGFLQWGGGIGSDKNVDEFNMAQLMS
jgi:beta-glucosidase-like glycosyl hydrolase